MSPNALAVPNPLTVFTAFTETTKIHTTNPIAATNINPTYAKTGPIKENIFSSSASCATRYDGSIAVREPHIRNVNIENTNIIGITGTYA